MPLCVCDQISTLSIEFESFRQRNNIQCVFSTDLSDIVKDIGIFDRNRKILIKIQQFRINGTNINQVLPISIKTQTKKAKFFIVV